MSSISFEYFPASWRGSMLAVEMKGKKRSSEGDQIPERMLIAGQYDQTKTTVTAGEIVQCYTADEVGDRFGYGSEIHRQAMWVFARLGGFSDYVWCVGVAQPSGTPVAATGTVVFAGTATSAGTYYFGIGGDVIALSVANGTTAAEVAAAFLAAITASIKMLISAAVATATATLTCKWKGATGNQIRVVLNPDGAAQEEANPSGITVTLPTTGYLTGGTGDPDLSTILFDDGEDNLGARWYTFLQQPYVDSVAIAALKSSWALRKDPTVAKPFVSFLGYVNKTYAEAYALPATINGPGLCPVWDSRSYAPAFELAAATAGEVMAKAILDPGRPFMTLDTGIPADPSVDNISDKRYDALFRAGMGTFRMDAAGELRIGDLATSYRTAASGAATEEWFDVVSVTRRQQKVWDVKTLWSQEPYTRGMVGSDDLVTSKDYVIKPKTIITALINLVDKWAFQGWTKNPETVKATIIAEINSSNNSRLDATLTDDEAQALRIIATKYAYLY